VIEDLGVTTFHQVVQSKIWHFRNSIIWNSSGGMSLLDCTTYNFIEHEIIQFRNNLKISGTSTVVQIFKKNTRVKPSPLIILVIFNVHSKSSQVKTLMEVLELERIIT